MYLKESSLSPDIFAAAYERGKSLDFDTLIAALLAKSEVSGNQLTVTG